MCCGCRLVGDELVAWINGLVLGSLCGFGFKLGVGDMQWFNEVDETRNGGGSLLTV